MNFEKFLITPFIEHLQVATFDKENLRGIASFWIELISFVYHSFTLLWRRSHHIETSPLICRVNQWTGFYMIKTSVKKELKHEYLSPSWTSTWRCSMKKLLLLKISQDSQEITCTRTLWHRCFPVNFAKFWRTHF